jgi:hypothetical protein
MLLEVLPVSLDVALLKLQLPELVLRPGMQVVARVASRGDGQSASIVLAGALLKATVPDEVAVGDTLKLTVADTSPERIVLKLDGLDPSMAAAALAVPTPEPELRRADPDAGGPAGGRGDDGRPGVSLVYETPALGRLVAALEAKTGTPATVRVNPRREPFDAYA